METTTDTDAACTSPWGDLLGPCVTGRVAAELLGVTGTELNRRRRRGELLAVQTTSRRWMYPLAQFRAAASGDVTAAAALVDVLAQLLVAGDGLSAARWMATPNRRLGRSTPWEQLDRNPARVVAAAEAQARAWAGSSGAA